MKRREFIRLIGGVAAAWPIAVGAQQPGRMRLVGVLSPLTIPSLCTLEKAHARIINITEF